MKILVTGGCGFIGSNFIHYMLYKYDDVKIVNLDNLTYSGNPDNLKGIPGDPRYSFIKGDICDKDLVRTLVKGAEVLVNFAAETHVDRSIKYPEGFLRSNVQGVQTLLESAKDARLTKFIQIGTDEVYGSVSSGFSKEADPLKPNSPYSATKAAGDLLALSYHSTYGLPVVVTRSSNNYGPRQYPEKVIPLFVTRLIAGGKVPLYGDGMNVRDWIYVADNCEAIDVVIRKGSPGEIYNIGGENQTTNLELTNGILELMGKGGESIERVADRPGHDRRYALDPSKTKALGWKPETAFKEGLKKTVQWYKEHPEWWKPLVEKAEIIKWG
ncbi:MAG: dTDP-glucose 4,6-dehydratase [Candidatus Omnitrophica bacterium]|nr:dTDP-glucose 4,6-dehydratase [Candidatus Omnitrophota bacterium]